MGINLGENSGRFFQRDRSVRFDYPNSKAYVSVAFGDYSDEIQIKITDTYGNTIPIQYDDITSYYDNRDAVVVASGDDVTDSAYPAFQAAFSVFQAAHIWFTPG